MKKISCNIMKDILPLYIEDVVSDDTKKMVEEHLSCCETCRKEAMLLKKDIVLPTESGIYSVQEKVLKNLKKTFRNKKIVVSLISVFTVLAAFCGVYALLVLPENVIPYDDSKILIEEIDGKLYGRYTDYDLAGTIGWNPSVLEIDGKKKEVTVFYFVESPWSNLEGKYGKNKEEYLSFIGYVDEIDEVYYGKFDNPPEGKLSEAVAGAELVWSK